MDSNFFNIPYWGFVPWVSQAITIIVLGVFLKHIISEEKKKKEVIKKKEVKYYMKSWGKTFVYATILIQLPFFFMAFISQIITLTCLIIIYANLTKYQDKI